MRTMTLQQLMKSIEEYNLNLADPFDFGKISITTCVDDYDLLTHDTYQGMMKKLKFNYTKEFLYELLKQDFVCKNKDYPNVISASFKVGDYDHTYKVSVFVERLHK